MKKIVKELKSDLAHIKEAYEKLEDSIFNFDKDDCDLENIEDNALALEKWIGWLEDTIKEADKKIIERK